MPRERPSVMGFVAQRELERMRFDREIDQKMKSVEARRARKEYEERQRRAQEETETRQRLLREEMERQREAAKTEEKRIRKMLFQNRDVIEKSASRGLLFHEEKNEKYKEFDEFFLDLHSLAGKEIERKSRLEPYQHPDISFDEQVKPVSGIRVKREEVRHEQEELEDAG